MQMLLITLCKHNYKKMMMMIHNAYIIPLYGRWNSLFHLTVILKHNSVREELTLPPFSMYQK